MLPLFSHLDASLPLTGAFKWGTVSTLEYLINVGVRLLIFWQISSHYALIPYPTFIDFIKKVHPVSLFYILLNWNVQVFAIFQPLASKKCWFFIILKEDLTHFIKFYTLEGNIPSPTINIFGKFPPNTFIPHPTFILLRVNVHPIWLFHTLPLLGTQEYLMQEFYFIKYILWNLRNVEGKKRSLYTVWGYT